MSSVVVYYALHVYSQSSKSVSIKLDSAGFIEAHSNDIYLHGFNLVSNESRFRLRHVYSCTRTYIIGTFCVLLDGFFFSYAFIT